MEQGRKNRDFSKGPLWDETKKRWLIEIRYPHSSRLLRRFRREREALRLWSSEQSRLENGTWHERTPKLTTLAAADPEVESPYVFVHPRDARYSGKPVLDVKNAFHTALEGAGVQDFTWHDFRHDYASRFVMAGVSLRAVAELLGHKGLRMAMRYAHLSPGYLSEEVKKLVDSRSGVNC